MNDIECKSSKAKSVPSIIEVIFDAGVPVGVCLTRGNRHSFFVPLEREPCKQAGEHRDSS